MAVITLVETTRWAARYCLHRVANVANVLIGLVGIGSLRKCHLTLEHINMDLLFGVG